MTLGVRQPPAGLDRSPVIKPHRNFEYIQFLRGLAACMVVFHHLCWVFNHYRPGSRITAFHKLADVGAGGVDIFFCISGFVITYAARNMPPGTRSAKTFIIRRLERVMPPYWFYTSVLILFWVFGLGRKS